MREDDIVESIGEEGRMLLDYDGRVAVRHPCIDSGVVSTAEISIYASFGIGAGETGDVDARRDDGGGFHVARH